MLSGFRPSKLLSRWGAALVNCMTLQRTTVTARTLAHLIPAIPSVFLFWLSINFLPTDLKDGKEMDREWKHVRNLHWHQFALSLPPKMKMCVVGQLFESICRGLKVLSNLGLRRRLSQISLRNLKAHLSRLHLRSLPPLNSMDALLASHRSNYRINNSIGYEERTRISPR